MTWHGRVGWTHLAELRERCATKPTHTTETCTTQVLALSPHTSEPSSFPCGRSCSCVEPFVWCALPCRLLGMTRMWVGAWGVVSRKASTRSSSYTTSAGTCTPRRRSNTYGDEGLECLEAQSISANGPSSLTHVYNGPCMWGVSRVCGVVWCVWVTCFCRILSKMVAGARSCMSACRMVDQRRFSSHPYNPSHITSHH